MSRVLLSTLVAALTAASLYSERAQIFSAVDEGLRSANVPKEAVPYAHAAPFLLAPLCAFCVVYCIMSMVVSFFYGGTASTEHVPMGVPVAVGSGVPYQDFASANAPPSGYFADGLCSCINDPKVCFATMLCPSVTIAQVYERVMSNGGLHFWAIFVPLALCGLLVAKAQQDCPTPSVECKPAGSGGGPPHCTVSHVYRDDVSPLCSLSSSTQVIAGLVSIALLVIVRQRVRARYNIAPACCGSCDDLCCAICCWPLATCQLVRHLCSAEGTGYHFISTTGAATAV